MLERNNRVRYFLSVLSKSGLPSKAKISLKKMKKNGLDLATLF